MNKAQTEQDIQIDPNVHVDLLTALESQLCFPFYAASRLIIQNYAPLLEKLGLTYPQYLVLMVLWANDGATVSEIGNQLFLDSGTLTPVLTKLEKNKLIKRSRSKLDDRKVHNQLTEKGKALKSEAAHVAFSLFCKYGLTVTELNTLKEMINKLIGCLPSNQKLDL